MKKPSAALIGITFTLVFLVNSLASLVSQTLGDDFSVAEGEVYQTNLLLDPGNSTPPTETPTTLDAEDADDEQGTILENSDTIVGSFNNGDWLKFEGIDMDEVRELRINVAGDPDSSSETTDTFTSAGSDTFEVPDDVTEILVQTWGAGGGGGGNGTPSGANGAAGGGGGFAEATLNVTPDETLNLRIGGGGSAGGNGSSASTITHSASNATAGSLSTTLNIGTAGTNRLVTVFAMTEEDNAISLSGVTVDGKTCNFVASALNLDGLRNRTELWYCDEDNLGASNGSVTVAINGSGVTASRWATHANLHTGVIQSGPTDSGTDTTSITPTATATVTGIDVAAGGLVVMGAANGAQALTVNSLTSPLTERSNADPASADAVTASGIESSAQSNKSYVLTWSTAPNRSSAVAASWDPAPTATGGGGGGGGGYTGIFRGTPNQGNALLMAGGGGGGGGGDGNNTSISGGAGGGGGHNTAAQSGTSVSSGTGGGGGTTASGGAAGGGSGSGSTIGSALTGGVGDTGTGSPTGSAQGAGGTNGGGNGGNNGSTSGGAGGGGAGYNGGGGGGADSGAGSGAAGGGGGAGFAEGGASEITHEAGAGTTPGGDDHENYGGSAGAGGASGSSGNAGRMAITYTTTSSVSQAARFDVRLDSPTGPLIGFHEMRSTGGWSTFATRTIKLTPSTGTRDLYLVGKSGASDEIAKIDWVETVERGGGTEIAIEFGLGLAKNLAYNKNSLNFKLSDQLELANSSTPLRIGDGSSRSHYIAFNDGLDRRFGWSNGIEAFSTFDTSILLSPLRSSSVPVACSSGVAGMMWMDTDTGLTYLCDASNGRNKWLSLGEQMLLGENANACASGSDAGISNSCVATFGAGLGGYSTTDMGLYIPHPITITGYSFSMADELSSGKLLREEWTGIAGTTVASLTSNGNYPNSPTSSSMITTFEGPTDTADNYGSRVRGYITPPTTGSYTFWIASDDASSLLLSTDDNPANATQIAYVSAWSGSQEWDAEVNQQSSAIDLTGGQRYYIEALQKEGTGGDNLAVAWSGPGISQQVIGTAYISPWLENCTFDVEVWGTGSASDDNTHTLRATVANGLTSSPANASNLNVDVAGNQFILWGLDNNCAQAMERWNLSLIYKYRHD